MVTRWETVEFGLVNEIEIPPWGTNIASVTILGEKRVARVIYRSSSVYGEIGKDSGQSGSMGESPTCLPRQQFWPDHTLVCAASCNRHIMKKHYATIWEGDARVAIVLELQDPILPEIEG